MRRILGKQKVLFEMKRDRIARHRFVTSLGSAVAIGGGAISVVGIGMCLSGQLFPSLALGDTLAASSSAALGVFVATAAFSGTLALLLKNYRKVYVARIALHDAQIIVHTIGLLRPIRLDPFPARTFLGTIPSSSREGSGRSDGKREEFIEFKAKDENGKIRQLSIECQADRFALDQLDRCMKHVLGLSIRPGMKL